MSSARLRLTSARWSEFVLAWRLYRDAEAKHWAGWGAEDGVGQPPPQDHDPLLLSAEFLPFIGVEMRTRRIVASITLSRRTDGAYEVGGVVDPDFRGQGYGREALNAICLLAHRHFGMTRLWAGCENTNIASQRWLAACEFVRADGPLNHVLPNGRVIESLWWQRSDDIAVQRCDNRVMHDAGDR